MKKTQKSTRQLLKNGVTRTPKSARQQRKSIYESNPERRKAYAKLRKRELMKGARQAEKNAMKRTLKGARRADKNYNEENRESNIARTRKNTVKPTPKKGMVQVHD